MRGRIGETLRYTQTLTLWRGVDRVDCATTIDDFIGEDRLLRLRWPCPVPGAMPVSEVGDAVVGRGFALLHNGSGSVDTAEHPWTLDNPAYGWFGLSSAARVRVGDGVRAVSVAEVVAPTEPMGGRLARDLVVALVRAGVTATCSSADKPRYGHLGVDSNLPDTRVALGGPDQNAFTRSVLAAADPAYAREVDTQLAKTGQATVWVPAAAPLAEGWIPGADLRDSRALPVLVIAGRDDAHLVKAIASVADDLADAEIVVTQHAPSGLQRFESRTVALCNRGVPSFAVETDGTLHTALMRSCTGWPSGVWIDEPRRTAPDGSNFQLQHWTHVFDYALVCGPGDWRHADVPDRSAEFSHPLQAVTASGSLGGLPATGSLLQVDPAGAVQLGALKAAGNPLAHGSAHPVDVGHVAIRLVETRGGDADVVVRSPLGTVSELRAADLLEQPEGRRHLTDVARPPDRHRAGATRPATPAGRRKCRAGTGFRNRATAVRAILAAQPRTGAAGRAARRRPRSSAPTHRRGGLRRDAAPDGGQRQQRRIAVRDRDAGLSARMVGQPCRAAVHAGSRRTSGSRRGA